MSGSYASSNLSRAEKMVVGQFDLILVGTPFDNSGRATKLTHHDHLHLLKGINPRW